MQLISFIFLLFLMVIFVALRVNQTLDVDIKSRVRNQKCILLIASLIFLVYADYRFAIVLGLLSVSTWFCAKNKKRIRYGVIVAIASLAYFKYTNFFIYSFANLFGQDYTALNIIVPIGVSFYTFSAISYLVDVSKQKLETRNLLDVFLYLSFFPKLTSGPIQRAKDFFAQMDTPRQVGWPSFSVGIQIFAFGLFKKLVLADRLSVFVNQVFATPNAFNGATVLLAVLSYSLQIYFDFSGYSDMAVGAARILDIRLPRNFNLPYLAHNVTEFWKRWHISLSSWLQEYLYYSLGGNRKGKVRTYLNLILTMVIGGIWHGTSWTYVIWGLLHGLALVVHKMWMKISGSQTRENSLYGRIAAILGNFIFVSFCWVFFRAESLSKACTILYRIVTFQPGISQPYMWFFVTAIIFVVSVIVAAVSSKKANKVPSKPNMCYVEGFYPIVDLSKFVGLVWFFVLCGLILGLAYTGGSPFIYGIY